MVSWPPISVEFKKKEEGEAEEGEGKEGMGEKEGEEAEKEKKKKVSQVHMISFIDFWPYSVLGLPACLRPNINVVFL